MRSYPLHASGTYANGAAEVFEPGHGALSISDASDAAETLARLFDCHEPLDADDARQVVEILSRIPDSQIRELAADPEAFRKSWNDLSPLFCGLPDTLRLEESVYKEWTKDEGHPLAGRKGLAWGDPAAHMCAVFEGFGLELPPVSDKAPDNLAVLLDFMAFLLRNRPLEEVVAFCRDHLDWLPELRKEAGVRRIGSLFLTITETAECLIGHVTSMCAAPCALPPRKPMETANGRRNKRRAG